MSAIAGSAELVGWGTDNTPWVGGNPADKPVSVQGITLPARSLAMHPGPTQNVAAGWRSPLTGLVKVKARVAHGQRGGNGIKWWIARATKTQRQHLTHGTTDGSGAQTIPAEAEAKILDEVPVESGDMISLVVGPKGAHQCDTTLIELVITEKVGRERVWKEWRSRNCFHRPDVNRSVLRAGHPPLVSPRRTCTGSVPDGQTPLQRCAGERGAAVVLQRAEIGSDVLKTKDAQVCRPLVVADQVEASGYVRPAEVRAARA